MFENIKFNGTFRSYQQKILDGAEKYLADGKINIVAALGSGKTILGLELIRRPGKPCLILSPTTTIRGQWGERFTQNLKRALGRTEAVYTRGEKGRKILRKCRKKGFVHYDSRDIEEEYCNF